MFCCPSLKAVRINTMDNRGHNANRYHSNRHYGGNQHGYIYEGNQERYDARGSRPGNNRNYFPHMPMRQAPTLRYDNAMGIEYDRRHSGTPSLHYSHGSFPHYGREQSTHMQYIDRRDRDSATHMVRRPDHKKTNVQRNNKGRHTGLAKGMGRNFNEGHSDNRSHGGDWKGIPNRGRHQEQHVVHLHDNRRNRNSYNEGGSSSKSQMYRTDVRPEYPASVEREAARNLLTSGARGKYKRPRGKGGHAHGGAGPPKFRREAERRGRPPFNRTRKDAYGNSISHYHSTAAKHNRRDDPSHSGSGDASKHGNNSDRGECWNGFPCPKVYPGETKLYEFKCDDTDEPIEKLLIIPNQGPIVKKFLSTETPDSHAYSSRKAWLDKMAAVLDENVKFLNLRFEGLESHEEWSSLIPMPTL